MSETMSLSSAVCALNSLLSTHTRMIAKERADAVTELQRLKSLLTTTDKHGLQQIDETKVLESTPVLHRKVWLHVLFYKVGSIDTLHDRYTADVIIHTKWVEPQLHHKKLEADDIDWSCYWNPNVSVSNSIGEPKCKSNMHLHYDHQGIATVTQKQHLNGQFFEFMELNKFPFDSQDLTITVVSDKTTEEVDLLEDLMDPSGVNPDAFSSTQEWAMGKKVNIWKKTVSKKINNVAYYYPCVCTAAKVSRRPQFFLYNIVIILFAISSLAFSTFAVKMETPEARMPLTFTLLLTTVTFKMVVNKNLPKISYLTYLDKYILGTMIILVGLCVWHAIAGSIIYDIDPVTVASATTAAAANVTKSPTTTLPSNLITSAVAHTAAKATCAKYPGRVATETGKMIDEIAMGCFATFYIIFHLVYLILIVCVANNDDNGPNEEIVEAMTQVEEDMGSAVDLVPQNKDKNGNQSKRDGTESNQNNIVIAAFGD